mmetsp:Transcript_32442/g.59469  ORF Transcript_32442/g.59469 Transcript_32442/m.59469 type:complete len:258 (+) Transcript_32442:269-1042(+)
MSTTARLRASSRGKSASAQRAMPARAPSALSKASPRASAQSSAVWWSSMCRSPRHRRARSKRENLLSAVSMWSRKPRPVSTCAFPVPSRSMVQEIWVSLVSRVTVAVRRPLWAPAGPAAPFANRGRFLAAPPPSPSSPVGGGGSSSSSSARPHSTTLTAPQAIMAEAILQPSKLLPSAARAIWWLYSLAWVSGSSTPTPWAPAATPAATSSGVSPTINALAASATPSLRKASATGKGSGLGGPSSMHTHASNRPASP